MSAPFPPQDPKSQTTSQQDALLREILITQQEQLQVSKKLLNTERFRVIGNWVKLGVFVALFYYSLVFTKDLIENFSTNMPSMMGNAFGDSANLKLDGAQDLATQLQGSQDLIRELLGN